MTRARTTAVIAILLGVSGAAMGARFPTRVIATSDEPAPSVPGRTYVSFAPAVSPVIDNRGDVAFTANPLDGPFTGAIYVSDRFAGARLVAASGAPAAGFDGGETYQYVQNPALDGRGRAVFGAILVNGVFSGGEGTGAFMEIDTSGAGVRRIASSDQQAVGFPPGVTYNALSTFFLPIVNAQGQVLLRAEVDMEGPGGSASDALYRETDGVMELVAFEGEPAPGFGPGSVLQSLRIFPALDASGCAGFVGTVLPAPGRTVGATVNGLFRGGPGTVDLVATAPGPLGPDRTAVFFAGTSMSRSGRLALGLSVEDPGGGGSPGVGLEAGDQLELIASNGDVVTAGGSNVPLDLDYLHADSIDVNDAGEVAFVAAAGGTDEVPDSQAILVSTPGGLRALAIVLQPAFGLAPGYVYWDYSFPEAVYLNESGQVAFESWYFHDAVNPEDVDFGSAVWATDGSGDLHLVATRGDEVRVAPGDVRTIHDARIGRNITERPTGTSFNDHGELAYQVEFEDGTTAILVSRIPALTPQDVPGGNTASILGPIVAGLGIESGATRADGDMDGDGDVDLRDVLTFIRNAGAGR